MWFAADGEFVLGVFGLRLDQVFVGAFLNVEFVVGYRGADGVVRRLRQQVNEETVAGVEALSLFQDGKAVLQHILNIKGPERCGDEHPVVKPS